MDHIDIIFDYETLAKQCNIGGEALVQLEKEVREEFPHDEMMFELHMIRALDWLHNQDKDLTPLPKQQIFNIIDLYTN